MKTTVLLEGVSQRYSAPHSSVEDQICYYARVSNPTSQANALNNERLIRYLIDHEHWSPFEMCSISVQIDTTRDISHQILRHRSMAFQEFSQRYSATQTTGDVRQTRTQDYKNRQNSFITEDEDLVRWWSKAQIDVMDLCFKLYDESLKRDVAKEQARAILPEGLTWTRLYMSGTVRSWIHYIQLRSRPETQLEHREIAMKCAEAISPVFPLIEGFVWDEAREREKRYQQFLDLQREFGGSDAP